MRKTVHVSLPLALALLLPACSSDDGTSGGGSGTGTATGTGAGTGTGTATGTGTGTSTSTSSSGSGTASGGSTGSGTGATSATGTAGSGDAGTAGSSGGGTAGTAGTGGSGSSGGTAGTTGGVMETDIEVVITADNAYGFGYGTDTSLFSYWGGVENQTAGEIFSCANGPELYTVPAADAKNATYLYIIAWADSAVTQGVLGRFHRKDGMNGFGEDVFTGDGNWEVCATGMNYSPGGGGPSEMTINSMIQACNADSLDPNTSSVGWVDKTGTQVGAVAIGEDNTTPYDGGPKAGNEFPLVCTNVMPAQARWMWFNWDPQNITWPAQSPFLWPGGGGNPDHQFLIFRLAADVLPTPQ